MESVLAVNKFVEEHNLEIDSLGNCEFEGTVEYESNALNASGTTIIRLIRNGYNDGNISISEDEIFISDDFHLDFSTYYQNYIYDADSKSLVVSGGSTKMSGNYHVTIKPKLV